MARRKKTKAVIAKQKKGKSRNDTSTSPEDSNEGDLNTSASSEFTLCISDDSDLVIESDTVAPESSRTLRHGRTEETSDEKPKALGSSSSITVTEAVVVDLTEHGSPKTQPSSMMRSKTVAALVEPDRRTSQSEGVMVPQENIIEECETVIEETVGPLKRSGRRRDSESSDEYEYSTNEGSEPISIEEMIGGVGSIMDSEYLLYDSVLNSALRSEVGCNIVIEACDVDEIPPGEEGASAERETPQMAASQVTVEDEAVPVAVEPEPLQVTKKEGDTFYSPRRRDRISFSSSPKKSSEGNSPPHGLRRVTLVGNLDATFQKVQDLADNVQTSREGRQVAEDVSAVQTRIGSTKEKYDGFGTRLCSVRVERMESATLSDKSSPQEPMDTSSEVTTPVNSLRPRSQLSVATDEEIATALKRINIEKKGPRRSSETSSLRGRSKFSSKKEQPEHVRPQAGKDSVPPIVLERMEVDTPSKSVKPALAVETTKQSTVPEVKPTVDTILPQLSEISLYKVAKPSAEAASVTKKVPSKVSSTQQKLETKEIDISSDDSKKVPLQSKDVTLPSLPIPVPEQLIKPKEAPSPPISGEEKTAVVESMEVSSSLPLPDKPSRPRRQTRQPRRMADAVKPKVAPRAGKVSVSPKTVSESKADEPCNPVPEAKPLAAPELSPSKPIVRKDEAQVEQTKPEAEPPKLEPLSSNCPVQPDVANKVSEETAAVAAGVSSKLAPSKSAAASPKAAAASPKPTAASPKPAAASPKPAAASPKPTAASPKPTAASPKPTAASPKPAAASPKPAVAPPKPAAAPPKPVAASPKPVVPPKVTPSSLKVVGSPKPTLPSPSRDASPSVVPSQKPATATTLKQAVSAKPVTPKTTAASPKSTQFPKPAPASPKAIPASPKAIPVSPKKEPSPTRSPSPKPIRGVVKLVDLPIPIPELLSPKYSHPRASDSPKRSSSPKSSSRATSKSSSKSTTPKTSKQSKPSKPASKTQSTPKAAKAPSPKPANKPSSTKAALPKGAKGIAKATAKLAMAKETSSAETPSHPEPMDVDRDEPAARSLEPPTTAVNHVNGGDDVVMKEDASRGGKTPKPDVKKETVKKPEGTRRRSNRIKINRWDEGPSLAAAAAAAAAAGFTLASHVPASMASVQSAAAMMSTISTNAHLSRHPHSPGDPVLPPPSSALLPPSAFEADKPVKVKSRWRRTSELEMGAGSLSSATSLAATPMSTPDSNVTSPAATLPPPLSPTPPPPPPDDDPPPPPPVEPPPKPTYVTEHPEITERMKNFEIIRENLYLTARHRSKEAKRMVCECTLSEEEILRGEPGCGEDCLNRLLFIECSNRCTLGDYCSNKRFQNCEYSKCQVVRTDKKGLGLIASSHIPSGEFLFEYVGEVLDPKEFRRRAKDYAKEKNLHYYFMALKSDAIIDATGKGNISRFINHSCDPNAETQKWTVNGELRIGFFSKRAIGENEEVTFDYQLQRYGKEAQRCYCESSNCRGWIGDEPEKDDKEEKDRNWEKMKDKREKKKTREELEEEIEKLRLSGIKNRAHTLMLNRLMVRAEDHSSRSQLLALTQADVDQRCLRLFLDYHGLNLLWSWMVDSSAPTSLKIQILDTFSVLPITNKTILLDSKVYGVVERWTNLGQASSNSSEPKAQREEDSSPDSEETSDSTGAKDKKVDELSDPNDRDRPTLIAKATALFQTWVTLKEEFRIPKKERLEQMKEHEREADRGYVDHEKAVKNEPSYDRHWSYDKDMSRSKRRGRDSPDSLEWKSRTGRGDDRNGGQSSGPRLTKTQRRQLFAMKVEEEERQKRLEEERWTNHQEQCYALGVDPNMSFPQNNGYFHPIGTKDRKFKKPKSREAKTTFLPDGSEMPPEMFGPGGMGPPQRYPPPPPSPFMGGPPGPPGPPLSPAFPPFHQMGMGPPGPSPPLGPPQGMLPPQGMGPGMPPPGMCPGGPMVPPGMFGPPPPGMPFPPGPMPLPGAMPVPGGMPYNPPMPTPPQPGYPAPPFMPGAPPVAMEPPPIDMPPSNPTPPQPASTVLILKLPKNWKICVDKDRRRSYFYHIKTKHAQWTFPSTQDVAAEEAKCGNIKSSTKNTHDDSEESEEDEEDSESDEEDSSSDEFEEKEEEEEDDEYDDHSLLVEAKRKAQEEAIVQTVVMAEPQTVTEEPIMELTSELNPATDQSEPALKKRREGLVTVNIISPRDEEEDYRKGIKKSKIKETKMKLARAKARAKAKAAAASSGKSRSKKAKTCEADTSSNPSRRIKDKFRVQMANVIVALLNPYRKADCKAGRITNTEDFKHLARKLTHFVMVKELRHISTIEDLQCNDNVKHKARDFIRKYMSKFGAVYSRQPDD